jgi:hypothetical protein
MPNTDDVVRIAKAAVAARLAGQRTYAYGAHIFDLDTGGYCARFVRICHESALAIGDQEWSYRAANAVQMEARLRSASTQINRPVPGCIVALNRGTGGNGHIALYVGDGIIAENTSSASRGNPRAAGTKLTPLALVESRVTGYYLAVPRGSGLRVLGPTGAAIECDATDDRGTTVVALRPLAEALGLEVDAVNYPAIQLRRRG